MKELEDLITTIIVTARMIDKYYVNADRFSFLIWNNEGFWMHCSWYTDFEDMVMTIHISNMDLNVRETFDNFDYNNMKNVLLRAKNLL